MRLPLDFSLRNDQHDSVLYLPDGAQALFFEISNIGLEHPITLENKGDTASDENFHFQLLFRPRVLRQIEVIRLNQGGSGVAGSDASIAIAEGANWNLAVSTLDPFNLGGQGGFVVLSLLRIGGGTLDPQSRLPLLLAGLNPDAKLGTRASRVEIKYDAVVGVPSAVPVGGDGAPASAPLQGVVMHHLNLINESRKVFEVAQQVGAVSSAKAGPFQATLIGSNTVVNDGKSSETLRIRVMNPDQDVDVQLDQEDEPTQFRVAWDVVPDDALHGLISSADGDAITTELTDASSFWTSTDGRTIEWGGNGTPTWRKDQSFDLTLNIAKSTAPSGYATIRIAWSHFPGYADGQLVLLVNVGPMFIEEGTGNAPGTIAQGTALPLKLVDKAPLELFRTNFRDQAATGASAANPDATLGFANDDQLEVNLGGGNVTNPKLRVTGGSGQFVTTDGATPFIISRHQAADNQTLTVGITDTVTTIHYKNDELSSRLDFSLQNTNTESGGGANANNNTVLSLLGNQNGGAVGIGTTNPGNFKLKVSGTADVTGALSVASLTATGQVGAASASITGNVSAGGGAFGTTFTGTDSMKLKVRGDASIMGNLEVTSNLRTDDIEIGHNGSSTVNSIRFESSPTSNDSSEEFHDIDDYLEISARNHGVLSHSGKQMLLWDEDGVAVNTRDGRFEVSGGRTFIRGGITLSRGMEFNGILHIRHTENTNGRGEANHHLIDGNLTIRDSLDAGQVSSTIKRFNIPHPTLKRFRLVHSCLEGPEAGVYYRGAGQLHEGKATIQLPKYFEALTLRENRTVVLTAKGNRPYLLSHSEVNNGQFTVFGTIPDGEFSWEVKAVRADVPELEVEVPALQPEAQNDGADVPVSHIIPTVNPDE